MKKILSILFLSLVFSNFTALEKSLAGLNATFKTINTEVTKPTSKKVPKDSNIFTLNNVTIHIVVGDIIQFPVQAVVNAANTGLRGGGGIDLYLYTQAGNEERMIRGRKQPVSKLREEMDQRYPTNEITINGVKRKVQPGDAVISSSQDIANKYFKTIKYIIHAIGPNCTIPAQKAQAVPLLYNAHMNSLQLANQYNLTSIAFPVISGAIYACPPDIIAQQAAKAVYDFAKNKTSLKDIYFVMYDGDSEYKIKETAFKKAFSAY